jgi:hypothetical protein
LNEAAALREAAALADGERGSMKSWIRSNATG